MIKTIGRPESKDVSIVSDSFLMGEIERIPSARTVGQEHTMTRPETNETLREFNRDTRGLCRPIGNRVSCYLGMLCHGAEQTARHLNSRCASFPSSLGKGCTLAGSGCCPRF